MKGKNLDRIPFPSLRGPLRLPGSPRRRIRGNRTAEGRTGVLSGCVDRVSSANHYKSLLTYVGVPSESQDTLSYFLPFVSDEKITVSVKVILKVYSRFLIFLRSTSNKIHCKHRSTSFRNGCKNLLKDGLKEYMKS